ncbi:MAG TPA: sigma-70 family RNA polymerase sigma factor [Anaerolineales bacterium]
MKSTLYDERSMLRAARDGDLEAFNQIVLAYQSFLFRTALNILGDEDAAEDATQEALISAFRGLGGFRGESLRSWLARVVINACYDQLRHQRRRPAVPLEQYDEFDQEMDAAPWLLDPAATPDEQVEERELQRAVQRGLQAMPPKYRLAAILVDLQGLAYEEAAEILRVPVGTVKSRLARARLALRGSLASQPDLLPTHLASPRIHDYV